MDTLYIEIKDKRLKTFSSDKTNGTKNFFFSFANPNFAFNLRLLHKLKHNVCLPRTACGIFHFRLRFAFVKVYIFVQQNAWILRL